MTRLVRPAESTIIDTSTKLSASEAQALYAAGVRSVWRYVFFGPPRTGDLDAAELDLLLAAGMTVMVVQHVRLPGWQASGIAQGQADAQWAIRNAIECGYDPDRFPGLPLCYDAEGVGNPGAMSNETNAWQYDVALAGFQPVIYLGYDSGLRATDLDSMTGPRPPLFWCDYAPLGMRPKPARGYVGHQQAQTRLCGVLVDVDALLVPGALCGLGDGDANTETVDPREEPTRPEIPLPFHAQSTFAPPPDDVA